MLARLIETRINRELFSWKEIIEEGGGGGGWTTGEGIKRACTHENHPRRLLFRSK